MSADAKVWQDKDGWHGIADFMPNTQLNYTNYDLSELLEEIEVRAGQPLHWEIFQFDNGPGLRGFRAR